MNRKVRKERIQASKIELSVPLEWPIYDNSGTILFKSGSRIYTEDQLMLLLGRDAHFLIDIHKEKIRNQHIFQRILHLITILALTLDAVTRKKPDSNQRVQQCVKMIDDICEEDMDGALGAIHLFRDHSNALLKPIFSGFLANIMARRIRYPQSRKDDLVTGMILCNIASMTYQAELDAQTAPLNKVQLEMIHQHPEEGVRIIMQAGINNTNVLKTVLQHHERKNGEGYPRGVTDQDIHMDGKIAALCEFYVAVTGNRNYKPVKQPKEALSEIYGQANTQEPYLYMEFIKELGAFPPGSIIRLANKEVAVITRRQKNVVAPIAKAILSPSGEVYTTAIKRDCNDVEFKILETCKLDPKVKLDLVTLWDYQHVD
ncbi:MAG: hypothetical protein JKY67_18710 [Pseudomonadales bacterium]|nr:hypothetical protein [Pseudomonadales bacterium]